MSVQTLLLNDSPKPQSELYKDALFTLGYEGLSVDTFIGKLKEEKIDILIDIREIPLSRKKGFSKSYLNELLSSFSIRYLHKKNLGSPSEIRHRVKETGNYLEFFENYQNYLETQKEELLNIDELIQENNVCLMCFEKDVDYCHRKVVASEIKKIKKNNLNIINL